MIRQISVKSFKLVKVITTIFQEKPQEDTIEHHKQTST